VIKHHVLLGTAERRLLVLATASPIFRRLVGEGRSRFVRSRLHHVHAERSKEEFGSSPTSFLDPGAGLGRHHRTRSNLLAPGIVRFPHHDIAVGWGEAIA